MIEKKGKKFVGIGIRYIIEIVFLLVMVLLFPDSTFLSWVIFILALLGLNSLVLRILNLKKDRASRY